MKRTSSPGTGWRSFRICFVPGPYHDGLETRTIVSGIAKHYQPEELVGKQVCFIANLAPRKLKGIVSECMILSAENNDGSLAVIMPQKEVKPGSEVK